MGDGPAQTEEIYVETPGTAAESSKTRAGYSVIVGPGALSSPCLSTMVEGRRVFIISSSPIRYLHGEALEAHLSSADHRQWLMVPDGEAAKRVEVVEELWTSMLDNEGKRDSLVVGFGGGSVGDLAGFAASTFLRGVDFIQVPTTLLAQVDASVGGKVGVDLPAGKNTVGAFYQPKLVVADCDLLKTLERRDLASGLVEAAKMGAILDLKLFEQVERQGLDLLQEDAKDDGPSWTAAVKAVVADSVRTKATVVERDPFERGERRLLNFGHTLGHAIEVCLGYEGLRHGEAVAWGIIFAARLSSARGLPEEDGQRLVALMKDLTSPMLRGLEKSELLAAFARDKKAVEDGLAWVLCSRLGEGVIATDLPRELIESELSKFLSDFC